MDLEIQHAKSWSGLWGNLRFIVRYKALATLAVFLLGVAAGVGIGSL